MWRVAQVGWTVAEPTLRADLELGQQAVVRPGDRVEDLELGEALGVLLVEHALAGVGDRLGAGGGVDHDRQRPLAAPAPEPLDHLVRLVAVGVAEAFRAPGQPAAAAGDVVRDPDRQPGPRRDLDQRLDPAAAGRRSGSCRRDVDGGGALVQEGRDRRHPRCRREAASAAGGRAARARAWSGAPAARRPAAPARERLSTAPQRFAAASAAASAARRVPLARAVP